MNPISIIIPVYNRADIVTGTLDSIYRQDYRPIRLFLVDNNSSDRSLRVLNDWALAHNSPDFIVSVHSELRPGAAAARNAALGIVTTPYVMFFDSDDLMLPTHVSRAMNAFKTDPSLDIVGWDIMHISSNGRKSILRFSDCDMRFRHTFNSSLSTARYAIKTSLILRAGGWDATLPAWNDYELGMRLLLLNPCVKKLSGRPTVIVRHTTASITGSSYSSRHSALERALDRCEEHIASSGDTKWLRYIRLKRVVLAALYAREGSPHARRLLRLALAKESSLYRRAVLYLAFCYTAAGIRGIHLLIYPGHIDAAVFAAYSEGRHPYIS